MRCSYISGWSLSQNGLLGISRARSSAHTNIEGNMNHKRIHLRVPVNGEASLSCGDGVVILTRTSDISAGGLRITDPTFCPERDMEYEVEVCTNGRGRLRFKGLPVYQLKDGIGMKILNIDSTNLRTIYHLVNDFLATEEFITHIVHNNILGDWFLDDDGKVLDVSFEEQ